MCLPSEDFRQRPEHASRRRAAAAPCKANHPSPNLRGHYPAGRTPASFVSSTNARRRRRPARGERRRPRDDGLSALAECVRARYLSSFGLGLQLPSIASPPASPLPASASAPAPHSPAAAAASSATSRPPLRLPAAAEHALTPPPLSTQGRPLPAAVQGRPVAADPVHLPERG